MGEFRVEEQWWLLVVAKKKFSFFSLCLVHFGYSIIEKCSIRLSSALVSSLEKDAGNMVQSA